MPALQSLASTDINCEDKPFFLNLHCTQNQCHILLGILAVSLHLAIRNLHLTSYRQLVDTGD